VNFLMHADFFSTMKPRIRIFLDRIEFLNPGALPKPLKMIIQEDISMPRNPVIAKVFRVAKLAENAGYGFDKMIDGWKPYADSKPEFDQGFDFTKSVFFFPGKSSPKTPVKTPVKTPALILKILKENPTMTLVEVADQIGKSVSAVERASAKLVKQRKLKRVGPQKGGHWEALENKKG
jgi:ATP-dependent DNA helicase RecG